MIKYGFNNVCSKNIDLAAVAPSETSEYQLPCIMNIKQQSIEWDIYRGPEKCTSVVMSGNLTSGQNLK